MSKYDIEDRSVREVCGTCELPTFGRAREVVAEYENGARRREIEVVVNGRYQPEFVELEKDG